MNLRFLRRSARGARGQAMTEVVLLFPMFVFFAFALAKIFAILILVQKVEIASYYAARRWQLESHRNVDYAWSDGDAAGGGQCGTSSPNQGGNLCKDIAGHVFTYIGYGSGSAKFLGLTDSCNDGKAPGLYIDRTQVWNIVTIRACTKPPAETGWMTAKMTGLKFEVTKYVPNRDRPIQFVLPGLQ